MPHAKHWYEEMNKTNQESDKSSLSLAEFYLAIFSEQNLTWWWGEDEDVTFMGLMISAKLKFSFQALFSSAPIVIAKLN